MYHYKLESLLIEMEKSQILQCLLYKFLINEEPRRLPILPLLAVHKNTELETLHQNETYWIPTFDYVWILTVICIHVQK